MDLTRFLTPVGKEADEEEYNISESDLSSFKMTLAFTEKRHMEEIEGSKSMTQTWRMKERVSQ